jgi:hypothetical protein
MAHKQVSSGRESHHDCLPAGDDRWTINPFYQSASGRLVRRGEYGGQHSASVGGSTKDVSDDEWLHEFELERLRLAGTADIAF